MTREKRMLGGGGGTSCHAGLVPPTSGLGPAEHVWQPRDGATFSVGSYGTPPQEPPPPPIISPVTGLPPGRSQGPLTSPSWPAA